MCAYRMPAPSSFDSSSLASGSTLRSMAGREGAHTTSPAAAFRARVNEHLGLEVQPLPNFSQRRLLPLSPGSSLPGLLSPEAELAAASGFVCTEERPTLGHAAAMGCLLGAAPCTATALGPAFLLVDMAAVGGALSQAKAHAAHEAETQSAPPDLAPERRWADILEAYLDRALGPRGEILRLPALEATLEELRRRVAAATDPARARFATHDAAGPRTGLGKTMRAMDANMRSNTTPRVRAWLQDTTAGDLRFYAPRLPPAAERSPTRLALPQLPWSEQLSLLAPVYAGRVQVRRGPLVEALRRHAVVQDAFGAVSEPQPSSGLEVLATPLGEDLPERRPVDERVDVDVFRWALVGGHEVLQTEYLVALGQELGADPVAETPLSVEQALRIGEAGLTLARGTLGYVTHMLTMAAALTVDVALNESRALLVDTEAPRTAQVSLADTLHVDVDLQLRAVRLRLVRGATDPCFMAWLERQNCGLRWAPLTPASTSPATWAAGGASLAFETESASSRASSTRSRRSRTTARSSSLQSLFGRSDAPGSSAPRKAASLTDESLRAQARAHQLPFDEQLDLSVRLGLQATPEPAPSEPRLPMRSERQFDTEFLTNLTPGPLFAAALVLEVAPAGTTDRHRLLLRTLPLAHDGDHPVPTLPALRHSLPFWTDPLRLLQPLAAAAAGTTPARRTGRSAARRGGSSSSDSLSSGSGGSLGVGDDDATPAPELCELLAESFALTRPVSDAPAPDHALWVLWV